MMSRRIKLVSATTDTLSADEAYKLVLKFVDRWKILFNLADTSEIQLEEQATAVGPAATPWYHFRFRKSFRYEYPVSTVTYRNELMIVVTNRGIIEVIRSDCVPTLSFPQSSNAVVDSLRARKTVLGQEIKVATGFGGNQVRDLTIEEQNIESMNLVIAWIRHW